MMNGRKRRTKLVSLPKPETITVLGHPKQVVKHHSVVMCTKETDPPVRCQIVEQKNGSKTYVELDFKDLIYDVCVVWTGCFYFRMSPKSKDLYYCSYPEYFTPYTEMILVQTEELKEFDTIIRQLKADRQKLINKIARRKV